MTKRAGAHVGIDLGTTYSLVAHLADGVPHVLPNALGEHLTASAVSVGDDGRMLVGASARARAVTHPERTAVAFKRDMGTTRSYALGDKTMVPEELSALVLGALRQDAEAALGMPVAEAVVTVPAYFGEAQRRATRHACELAGLPVERIINEPTAAALAYGLRERARELRAVVLDLGGGTFDVTVLEILEGVIEIQASAGDTQLGGEDFDDALVEHVRAVLAEKYDFDAGADRRDGARLREAVELAKQRLSFAPETALALPHFGRSRAAGPCDVTLALTRDAAEACWQPLLERVRAPIARALRDARVNAARIDEVLLVGGATRMPCVQRLAAQLFGRLPLRSLPPDEAVALGAAVQAAIKADDASTSELVVTDIAPFTLGVATSAQSGRAKVNGLFEPVIERGTVLPASRSRVFSTMSDEQRQVKIEIYQGEHSLCRDNQKLGEYLVSGIPPAAAGEQSFEIRFSYDLNGILEVDTTVLSTNRTASHSIVRTPGTLDAAALDKIRARLRALKLHPREALPNATVLARADALFAETTGDERAHLGAAMAQLRAALETEEPEAIARAREALQGLVDTLRARARGAGV